MSIQLHRTFSSPVAEVAGHEILLSTAQQTLEFLMDPDLGGARSLIVHRENIAPAFFDLRTGLAGDIAQKLVNYGFRLAIVGDFSDGSPNFQAFVRESNRGKYLYFVNDVEEALQKLES